MADLKVLNVDTYHKIRASSVPGAQSVERPFYKTQGHRFRPQWFFSFFFLFLLFSFIIAILNFCKVDYKVFIIKNNKLIYMS